MREKISHFPIGNLSSMNLMISKIIMSKSVRPAALTKVTVPSTSLFILLRFLCLSWIGILIASVFTQAQIPEIIDGRLTFPLERSDPNKPLPSVLKTKTDNIHALPENLAAPELPLSEIEDFTDYLIEGVQDYQLPGFAFAIVQDDKILYRKSYGVRSLKTQEPVDADTIFNIGPASQAITSLLAASLATPQESIYDQKVYKLMPSFQLYDADSQKRVTLRHLLSMTAGIPDYTDNILDPEWSRPEDVFTVMGQAPIIAKPGVLFNSSNVSVSSAAYLIAQICEDREDILSNYKQQVKARLFEPMGMSRSTFTLEDLRDLGNYASSHRLKDSGYETTSRWEPSNNATAPAVSLKSSLNDMAQWLSTELRAGKTTSALRIAPEAAVKERWRPGSSSDKSTYGMGWTRQVYQDIEIIANTGSYDRQSAGIGLYPRFRTGFVCLTNADGSDANKIMQEVALGLAEMLLDAQQSATAPEEE